MLKDWGFHKAGAKVDIFDNIGKQWIAEKIAVLWTEQQAIEEAVTAQEAAERALEFAEASLPVPENAAVKRGPGRPRKVQQ